MIFFRSPHKNANEGFQARMNCILKVPKPQQLYIYNLLLYIHHACVLDVKKSNLWRPLENCQSDIW